ncbi:sugar ABC transporter ATP-binding protein [Xaviernesmea oryzae]|uniref:Sugar ABC transporter ATP-binding protein n=1 Tax=Xaviernesmea oryzae TaxID=464029 RepID=A0A1Q9AR57_9HYPH|nr:ABC transporter ATP-binding protein [Xaviernesmea oryzae]OLP57868.1 sugar ABC transporter ATP-binding protein [Xaviernesmea oryzae]SEL33461.1 multiple sugar transport system ATP-binding protein [Xaviernesmea oryzae]
MAFLHISGLRKRYGALEILKGIDIELDKGGFLVLVGPSGCGKSTLLNTIAGLETITEGDIKVDERSIAELHPSKRDIAMVFQSYALYPNMTVAGNIAFGMEMRGVPADERKLAIDKVAKVLQIGHLLDRKPSQLSGGQRQRVAMGRALVRDPKLFLFDEPLSNLDAKLRVDMRTEIKRLHQTTGKTIVYVTHDQIEAMTLATKIAVMKEGIVQQFGTPAEIYNNPANMFVADFMGSPAMNLLSGRITREPNGLAVALERAGGEAIRLPVAAAMSSLAPYENREVVFGIRPEALTDPEGADRHAQFLCENDCLIDVVEPAGSDTFAVTKLGGREVVARLRADARIRAGEMARLAFNLDKAVFFDPQTQARIA